MGHRLVQAAGLPEHVADVATGDGEVVDARDIVGVELQECQRDLFLAQSDAQSLGRIELILGGPRETAENHLLRVQRQAIPGAALEHLVGDCDRVFAGLLGGAGLTQ